MKIASFVISVTAMCISIAALVLALVRRTTPCEKKQTEETADDFAAFSEEPETVEKEIEVE